MKKMYLALVLIAILLATGQTQAQLSMGTRVAANVSTVAENGSDIIPSSNLKYRTGLAVGLVTAYRASRIFALQTEILFTQYGHIRQGAFTSDFMGNTSQIAFRYEVRTNYLQIPLLANARFGGDLWSFHLIAGPHVGLGVDKVRFAGSLTEVIDGQLVFEEHNSAKESWDDANRKRLELGMTGGIGMSLALGQGRICLDARYQMGLTNLIKETELSVKMTNRNIQLGLSYLIPLGT
jgi:hypothetical protein